MKPLFLAVICGCHAGLFREALHEIYIPRIQRGNASFTAKTLGARSALLSVLVHFFENSRWVSPVETGVEGQRLTEDDQLFILMQAALHLTVTRGLQTPEVRLCYERAELLCHSQRTMGAILFVSLYLGLKAEALHLTDRTDEALEAIDNAEALVESFEEGCLSAELGRLRGVVLAARGAGEAEVEAAFCRAIQTAKLQKSISLIKCAEASYAAFRAACAAPPGFRTA